MLTGSRRDILALATAVSGASAAAVVPASAEAAAAEDALARRIIARFRQLPGDHALMIWAPATRRQPSFRAAFRQDKALFCASAFKSFVLAKHLKDLDAEAPALNQSLAEELVLDERVWTPGSPVFNPPGLKGKVQIRTAMEAMIARSDNTATDMLLRHVGADRVRNFIRSIGLETARIPTTTRSFFGYLLGAPDYRNFTWKRLVELLEADAPFVNPPINNVETMVCSPADFVSFYKRALQGRFFSHAATLDRFKAILMLADAIPLVAPPATTFHMKGGSLDAGSQHALCIAGGAYIPERWVYFGMTINWRANTEDAGPVPGQFGAACQEIFAWIKDELGS